MAELGGGPRRQGLTLTLAFAVLLATGVWLALSLAGGSSAQQAPAPGSPAPVPVTVGYSARKDVPLYFTGLGLVQAFNSVLVRSRVDGTLTRVAVSEGQEVKEGDLLAVIDPRPYQAALDAALAKTSQDEAQLANARLDMQRYQSLAKQDFASRQQVDTQQSQVKQLTAALAGDNAAVEAAKLNLSYCFITSPIQGRVGLRQVDPGNMVHASDATGIITITQLHPISVVFTLPGDTVPRINLAMAGGELPVTALASDGKTELDNGTLLTPDNAIDSTTGTIRLKATFPNPNNTLWPGQFVNARLLITTERNVLTVPSAAVQHGPNGLYVYAVKPDSTVTRQDVEVARNAGALAVISKGLDEQQAVVTDGQSRLQQGTRVAVSDPAKQATTQAKSGG
jgi:multidrug efflux system membrane fusion protein